MVVLLFFHVNVEPSAPLNIIELKLLPSQIDWLLIFSTDGLSEIAT